MSLKVSFSQCVDLAVNPLQGTINPPLLHNLLRIIINQLQLSSSFIEFHGAGSASIENHIVNNQQRCGFEINEFEIQEEVDEAGNKLKRRKEIKERDRNIDDVTVKLFSIRNFETDCESPIGYPLSPIQVLSTEQMQNHQRNSIHDVIFRTLPSNETIIKSEKLESPLKAMFDYINASKRLDALEIGTRQLAELLKTNQCVTEKSEPKTEVSNDTNKKDIDPMVAALMTKVDEFLEQMTSLQCKCNDDAFKENFTQEYANVLSSVKLEITNLESMCKSSFEEFDQKLSAFEGNIEKRLESLVEFMMKIQDILSTKVDKLFIPELKENFQKMIQALDEKIENIESKKALAAGAAKKIFKDLNCVSCGEHVIQADVRNLNQSMLAKSGEIHFQQNNIDNIQLLKALPTRLCGGNHTITTPRERIFRSENCQN